VEIDTRVRGAAVPPNDRIWQRHRNEVETLGRLGTCDVLLIGGAKELTDTVTALPADVALDAAAERQIDERLAQLSAILSQRGEILAIF
jgi:hypothetical protein